MNLSFLVVLVVVTLSGCGADPSPEKVTFLGEQQEMGDWKAYTYVELDSHQHPIAIGVAFTKGLLEGLPSVPNNTSRCFDRDGNGAFHDGECIGDYERILLLPDVLAQRSDIPIQWASVNWNPKGHPQPAPPSWKEPYFAFYFYMASREAVQHIRPGTCGFLMDCEDFQRATIPLPEKFLPRDYTDVGRVFPATGNHLIDSTTLEIIEPSQKFTHTFIYGAYDGHVTFYDPRVAHEFLMARPDECVPLKLPEAWEARGYYPTRYCVRYLKSEGEYTVSLEGFVSREAEVRYW